VEEIALGLTAMGGIEAKAVKRTAIRHESSGAVPDKPPQLQKSAHGLLTDGAERGGGRHL